MLVKLVLAAVFKTVGPYVKHAAGGFDSHALPPFSLQSRQIGGQPRYVRQNLQMAGLKRGQANRLKHDDSFNTVTKMRSTTVSETIL